MKKLIHTSMIYFIIALVAGVFYREFTKFNGFAGQTVLSVIHTHLFVLGMFLFLILALFAGQEKSLCENRLFGRFFILYNISLPFMVCTMLVRGILQVLGTQLTRSTNAMISGIAGISHILITVSFCLLFAALKKSFSTREQ